MRYQEAWAVWNDCNGPFEVMWRRSDAQKAIDEHYHNCGATLMPVRVTVEPEDNRAMRHWTEDAEYGRAPHKDSEITEQV